MITISDSAVKKIKSIIHEEDPSLKLRVFVQGGGCSGFQYGFSLEELPAAEDDFTFERDGVGVVVDMGLVVNFVFEGDADVGVVFEAYVDGND